MDEVRLKIRKRAVPGRGRARLHTSMLSELGVQEESKLEIVNEVQNKSITVTLFADLMVEEGYIRLGADDLDALGMNEEDTVVIRRKPPVSEKMRETAGEAAERIERVGETVKREAGEAAERVSGGFERVGETVKREAGEAAERVSGGFERVGETVKREAGEAKAGAAKAYGRIVEEAAPVTERIEGATRETVSRIKEEVTPVTERVEGAAKEAYAKITEELPLKDRLSKAADAVVSRLKPDEEAKLKKVLGGSKGNIQIATVTSELVADKLVKELDLPQEVVISAVQRNKEIIIPKGDTRLVRGDIVFLVGKEESLRQCAELLEG